MNRPIIGVTVDIATLEGRQRLTCSPTYVDAISRAGGAPVLLGPDIESIHAQIEACDGFVLTGGDDPRTDAYGEATHPKVTPVHERRQSYEEALLARLSTTAPDAPVLGVCLGMQMMGLAAGGRLDQYMPETCDPAGKHWDGIHRVDVTRLLGESAEVFSRHKQCLSDAGALETIAVSEDGVIEAVADVGRRFYVGVQWHPERTDGPLGSGPFELLVEAAQGVRA